MPQRPVRICEQPGCGQTSNLRYCAKHRPKQEARAQREFDRRRGSASQRGYGRRWEKLRRMVLARDPLCRMRATMLGIMAAGRAIGDWRLQAAIAERLDHFCLGTRPSVDADHIVPKPTGDDNESNLQGVCHECHTRKTNSIDAIIEEEGRGAEILQLLALADRQRTTKNTPAK
ncbi:MAG: HNH endonuclease [Candidatus Acidiferrales bacterium]